MPQLGQNHLDASNIGSFLDQHWHINTLRLRQDGRHFPDDIFKWIFLNEVILISIKISLKFVLIGPINNIPALVQIMAWRRPGDKPLSEPMMVSLLTHICVTRPQWVKACLEGLHWSQLNSAMGLLTDTWNCGLHMLGNARNICPTTTG